MTMLQQARCLFIFLVILAAFSVKEIEAKNENEYPSPRIMLLTYEGVMTEKMQLGNVLLNRDEDSKQPNQKCFKDDETKEMCIESGDFRGLSDRKVTLVDTPAFKTNMSETEKKKFCNDLKNNLGYVDVFLIVFPATGIYDGVKQEMVTLIEGMFGEEFWKHAMLEVAYWGFHPIDVKKRNENAEQTWKKDRINSLREHHNIPDGVTLDTTFIDSRYRLNNNDELEKENFIKYADKLWDFANTVGEFQCDKCKVPLTDFEMLKAKNERYQRNITETQNKMKELEEEIIEKDKKMKELEEENIQLEKENSDLRTDRKEDTTKTSGLETQYIVIIAFVCFGIGLLACHIVHTNRKGQNDMELIPQDDDDNEGSNTNNDNDDEGSNTNNVNDDEGSNTTNNVNDDEGSNTNNVNDTSHVIVDVTND